MWLATLAIVSCAAWWLLSLAIRLGSVAAALVQPAVRARAAIRREDPPISALVPVNRLDCGLEAAFVSLFSQSYPRFEVLVSAARESCPALAVARSVAARFPKIRSRFIVGEAHVAVSPKLDNLVIPLAEADHDLVLVKDANVHLAPGQLAAFVQHLGPGVGLVCAVPIATEPATFAAEIECAMINGHAAPLLLAASALGWGFGYGKILLFDRRDFERAGGVAAIAHAIGEDHALSKAMARIGLRTVFAESLVRQTAGPRTFREVWQRQLRWMVVRRCEAPLAFYLEPFFSCLFTASAGAIGASVLGMPWWVPAAVTPAAWFGIEALFLAAKGCGFSWRSPFAAACRELMIPALWVQALATTRVYWSDLPLDVPRRRAA
jgi:ceramide glucosyltransferase